MNGLCGDLFHLMYGEVSLIYNLFNNEKISCDSLIRKKVYYGTRF